MIIGFFRNATSRWLSLLSILLFIASTKCALLPVTDEEAFNDAMDSIESGDILELGSDKLELENTIILSVANITIRGESGVVRISCPPNGSAFDIRANVTIENVLFTGCTYPSIDVLNNTSSLTATVRNCIFRDNQLNNTKGIKEGAGIRVRCLKGCENNNAILHLSKSRFEGNFADRGGGIFALNSDVFINDTTFIDNKSNFGGSAIYSTESYRHSSNNAKLNVTYSSFRRNHVLRVGLSSGLTDRNGKPMELVTYYTFPTPLAKGGAVLVNNILHVNIFFCNFSDNRVAAGGAMAYIYDGTRTPEIAEIPTLLVKNCTFVRNYANHSNPVYKNIREVRLGGALYIAINTDQAITTLFGCKFHKNEAYYGGAIHLVASSVLEAKIEECNFTRNYAYEAGGAVLVRYIGQLNWYTSDAKENVARQGGAIMITNQAGFHIRGLAIFPNHTTYGVPSVFTNNAALDGAVIMCAGCGPVDIQHPQLLHNKAVYRGGAVNVLESVHNFRIQHVTAIGNEALIGGAFAAESAEHFSLVTDGDFRANITNNTAVMGGGVYYNANRQRENTVYIRGQIFEGNEARPLDDIEDSLVKTEKRVTRRRDLESSETKFCERLVACRNSGGGAVCIGLTRVPTCAFVDVILEVSQFIKNKAEVGGGIHISLVSKAWNTSTATTCSSATNHQGMFRKITFRNVSLDENIATKGGGGAFVSDPYRVICTCDKQNKKNSTLTGVIQTLHKNPDANVASELHCANFTNNSVQDNGGEYGRHVASAAFKLELSSPKEPFEKINSGDTLFSNGSDGNPETYILLVKDAFGQTITGGRPEAKLLVNVKCDRASGQTRYEAEEGRIVINQTRLIAEKKYPTGTTFDNITFEAADNDELNVSTYFKFRKCYKGEEWNSAACVKCPKFHYSFDPEGRCEPCPENGNCTGGATLTPKARYWHSTPFSSRFHKCLVDEACEYEGRQKALTDYFENLQRVSPSNRVVDNEEYPQCREGYQSRLCGSCSDGYGRVAGGECESCKSSKVRNIVLIVVLSLWIGALVALEVINTIHTNQEFKELKQVRQSVSMSCISGPMGNCGPLPPQPADSPFVAEGLLTESRRTIQLVNNRCSGTIVITDQVPSHIASSEKLTELIKIFVNFMQITSVAVSMNLQWQSVIKGILRAHEILTGITHGASYLPLECNVIESSVPGSIAALWIRISLPFVILVVFLLLGCVYFLTLTYIKKKQGNIQHTKPFDLMTYCIITAIAVSFFAYKDVTEELMRSLNCIKIDSKDYDSGEGPSSASTNREYSVATSSYWGEDTSLECFKGCHLVTGIFGVLGLATFSVGTVIFNAALLLGNMENIGKERFIARYGFLYRSYRPKWYTIAWEAVISVRKALVSAAVVYAFRLGRNLQAIIALGVLILAQAAHLICWPFKDYDTCPSLPEYAGHHTCLPFGRRSRKAWLKLNDKISLNYLESASLLTSTITFYSGLVFNDEQTSQAGTVVMTIFAASANIVFFLYMLYRVYYGFHVMVNEMSAYIERTCDPSSGFEYVRGPGILKLCRRTNRLVQYKYREFLKKVQNAPAPSNRPVEHM